MKSVFLALSLVLLAVNAQAGVRLVPHAAAQDVESADLAAAGLVFHPIAPCRAYNTPVGASFVYDLVIRGFCGVPAEAEAITFVVAAFQPELPGNLLLWQWGQAKPVAVTLNFSNLVTSSSGGLVFLCDPDGPVVCEFGEFYLQSTRSMNRFIMDITGYFAAP